VCHINFENGNITGTEDNKLTLQFYKAGEKRGLDGFVSEV
jgi:DNA helicase II / ATP-dependent DNA helicase PcrA